MKNEPRRKQKNANPLVQICNSNLGIFFDLVDIKYSTNLLPSSSL